MDEVFKKIGELAVLLNKQQEDLDGLRAKLKEHESMMEEHSQKNKDALAAQKKDLLEEIGNHDAAVMAKIDLCKEMVDGNKIAIDHQSERLVRAIKRIDQTIEETFQQANRNMLGQVQPMRTWVQMVAEVMRMTSILDK